MDAKEAAQAAKNYVLELFGDEGIANIGLEEIEMDRSNCWKITIGFNRTWDRTISSVLGRDDDRSYKVIQVSNKNGRILSVRDRILASPM